MTFIEKEWQRFWKFPDQKFYTNKCHSKAEHLILVKKMGMAESSCSNSLTFLSLLTSVTRDIIYSELDSHNIRNTFCTLLTILFIYLQFNYTYTYQFLNFSFAKCSQIVSPVSWHSKNLCLAMRPLARYKDKNYSIGRYITPIFFHVHKFLSKGLRDDFNLKALFCNNVPEVTPLNWASPFLC